MNKTFYVIFLLVFVACSTVPITGRKQLKLIPNGQLLPMSFEQYTQVLSESKLSTDEEKVAMIKRVGQKIQTAAEDYYKENYLENDLVGYDWEYNLIVSDQVNAWCMPGGKIAVYTGILDISCRRNRSCCNYGT